MRGRFEVEDYFIDYEASTIRIDYYLGAWNACQRITLPLEKVKTWAICNGKNVVPLNSLASQAGHPVYESKTVNFDDWIRHIPDSVITEFIHDLFQKK